MADNYGFVTYSTSGKKLLTSDTMPVSYKQTITPPKLTDYWSQQQSTQDLLAKYGSFGAVTFSYTNNAPENNVAIALKPNNGAICLIGDWLGTPGYSVASSHSLHSWGNAQYIEFYNDPLKTSSSAYGLEVRDSAGNIVFDNKSRPIKVIATYNKKLYEVFGYYPKDAPPFINGVADVTGKKWVDTLLLPGVTDVKNIAIIIKHLPGFRYLARGWGHNIYQQRSNTNNQVIFEYYKATRYQSVVFNLELTNGGKDTNLIITKRDIKSETSTYHAPTSYIEYIDTKQFPKLHYYNMIDIKPLSSAPDDYTKAEFVPPLSRVHMRYGDSHGYNDKLEFFVVDASTLN